SRVWRASQPQESPPSYAPRVGCSGLSVTCELRLQARSFALRQPKEQFVLIQVAYYNGWLAPLEDGRLDAFFLDVLAKRIYLIVIKANEHAAVTRPILRRRLSLIQDQLEPQQAHFKYRCPALY